MNENKDKIYIDRDSKLFDLIVINYNMGPFKHDLTLKELLDTYDLTCRIKKHIDWIKNTLTMAQNDIDEIEEKLE